MKAAHLVQKIEIKKLLEEKAVNHPVLVGIERNMYSFNNGLPLCNYLEETLDKHFWYPEKNHNYLKIQLSGKGINAISFCEKNNSPLI